jgi:protein-L-isoaspartate(D-aspartate) O-methyltransferase
VERLEKLATLARHRLQELGYHNVEVLHGNGTLGWPAHAPYDGIVVTASGPHVPEALQAQLGMGSRLVMPLLAPIGAGKSLYASHVHVMLRFATRIWVQYALSP